MKIVLGADHGGWQMKEDVKEWLGEKGYEVKDFGTDSTDAVNYPDFGHPLAEAVESGRFDSGISLCGSGNGINMVTNKHQGIRGALCWNKEISTMARLHNDANICSLPARYLDLETAREIVDAFLDTDYEGGRHDIRTSHIPIQR